MPKTQKVKSEHLTWDRLKEEGWKQENPLFGFFTKPSSLVYANVPVDHVLLSYESCRLIIYAVIKEPDKVCGNYCIFDGFLYKVEDFRKVCELTRI